jgi:hypothetical protein
MFRRLLVYWIAFSKTGAILTAKANLRRIDSLSHCVVLVDCHADDTADSVLVVIMLSGLATESRSSPEWPYEMLKSPIAYNPQSEHLSVGKSQEVAAASCARVAMCAVWCTLLGSPA